VRDVIAAAHDDGASIVHLPELLCVRRHAGPAVKKTAPGLVSLPRRPLVSIVIPTAAHGRHLERCLGSIAKLTTYEPYEVVIVDSSAGRLPDVRAMLAPTDVSVALADTPFNYSDATNRGVHKSRGEYLVLLNDDIEVISEDWLERMLELALRPGVGVVGAKLVRKDGTLQHGGVIIEDQQVRHLYEDLPADNEGYHGLLNAPRNCLAVTGACMMISAALYRWLGGLDPGFVLEYGDIDLCLRARGCSERIAWTPHAVLRHDEFSSRGTDSPVADHALFEARWSAQLAVGDPYSPSLVTHPDSEPRAA
jgi:GT2 family glycosyltransferase